jgi:hypothetical protein
MHRKKTILHLALAALPLFSLPILAQDPPATIPATAPAELQATITAVEGLVQVRESETDKWKKAEIGMVIGQGAEFRTGPRSAVRFELPPDQTVTLDRLGTVKLMDALKTANSVKTDLGMKYGRVRYDIEAAGLQHDSTIHSPGAALAVTGTRVSLYDQPPFKPEAVSLTGVAQFRNAKKQMIAFGGKGKGKTTIKSESTSAAQAALDQSLLLSFGVQETDQQIRELAFLFSHQGQLVGNVVSSNIPVTDRELPSLLGGNLDFVLRWNTPGHSTDLNIAVQTPLKENFGNPPFILSLVPGNTTIGGLLSQNFPQSTPSGGSVGLNSIGPAGIEIASFGSDFPKGVYTIAAYNFIPPDPRINTANLPKVPFTIEAFEHGHRLPLVLNLAAASAGAEAPRFGYIMTGAIALSEIQGTAVIVRGTPADYRPPVISPQSKRATTPRPAPPIPAIPRGNGKR